MDRPESLIQPDLLPIRSAEGLFESADLAGWTGEEIEDLLDGNE